MDGILIVNKPKDLTSHDVVAKVKKLTNEKVGHTGTLDPMATGVLPLLLGKGTKLSKYLIEHDKVYEATLHLGMKTDTADGEGRVVEKEEVNKDNLKKETVVEVLNSFLGKQKQIPPIYSAIKVKGKKLYEYARENKQVEIKPREIEIYAIKLLAICKEDICFMVHCSKGTYIRTLCEDIATKLGTIGYMKTLNRIQVGKFTLKQAISLQEIETNIQNKNFGGNYFISIEKFFENLPEMQLDDRKLALLLNGVSLTIKKEDGLYQIKDKTGKWVGVGTIKNSLLKRELII